MTLGPNQPRGNGEHRAEFRVRLFKKLRSHPHLKKTKSIGRHNLILKLERPGTVGAYKLLSGSHPLPRKSAVAWYAESSWAAKPSHGGSPIF